MSNECKECWHNYHCPLPQEGYDFDPDTCPHNPDNEEPKTCKDCPHTRKCPHIDYDPRTCKHKKDFDSRQGQKLIYGERVRFYWVDEWYENNIELVRGWEGYLEGLYGGIYNYNQSKEGKCEELAIVTVTTEGQFRGRVLHPCTDALELVQLTEEKKMEKKEYRNYDRQSLYEMRDNIMDNFDFGKVARVMEFLDWGWATGEDYMKSVPTEPEIRKFARSMMTDLIEKLGTTEESTAVDCGGFRVEFDDYDDIPNLRLVFMVDEWDEGYECWDEYCKGIAKRKEQGKFKPIPKN